MHPKDHNGREGLRQKREMSQKNELAWERRCNNKATNHYLRDDGTGPATVEESVIRRRGRQGTRNFITNYSSISERVFTEYYCPHIIKIVYILPTSD